MIRSFFQLGIRNLFRKNRMFTLINIAGLAVGLSSFFLIALFINDEYSFDAYHTHSDRIYRIVLDFQEEGNTVNWARSSAPIGEYVTTFPEVEQAVRLRKNPGSDLLTHDEIKFYEERLFFADSTLFEVFDFPLVRGDQSKALLDKNSMVITEALANKYFKGKDPIGQTLRLNNVKDVKITGVMEEIPANSHFVADAFITFSSLDDLIGQHRLTHWGWMDHYTYVLLSKGSDAQTLQSKLPDLIKNNAPEWVSEKEKLFLQPLKSIHLHSDRKDEINPNSHESYSYVLGTIAIFILLMACANFINLSTATLTSRFKEITIQKVLGANRWHMAIYFWIESILISLMSWLVSLALSYILLPYFNLITGKQLVLFENNWLILGSIVIAMLITILSGIVPTIQLGRLTILNLTNRGSQGLNKSAFRTTLTTFQFCISILLITATLVVSAQFSFLKSSRMGFQSDQVVVLPVKDRSQNSRHTTITNQLKQLSGVEMATYSSSTPGSDNAYTYTYTLSGSESGEQTMAVFFVDENFFDFYGVRLKEGRYPDINQKDTLVDVVLNNAAVKQLHLTQPIGQLVSGQVRGRVVGVVEDFNFAPLHSAVAPMIMYAYPQNFRFVSVRLKAGETQKQLAELENGWQEFYPDYPLEYFFLDDKIQQLYGAEAQLSKAYSAFSIIALVIAGIGLMALSTYLLNRKLKEISIRKVFGSSTLQLIGWVYKGYLKVIILATLIAWVLGYYWMKEWLQGFAFQAKIDAMYFILPVVGMVIILLLATGIQTFVASRTNPVRNLREE